MSSTTKRGAYRRREATPAHVKSSLVPPSHKQTRPGPARPAPARRAPGGRVLCDRCLEPREREEFPAPGVRRGDVAGVRVRSLRVCRSCLREAVASEEARLRLEAWDERRSKAVGLDLERWAPGVACRHCGRTILAVSPYAWACRRGCDAGVCEGIRAPHVHAACRACAYENLFRLEPRRRARGAE